MIRSLLILPLMLLTACGQQGRDTKKETAPEVVINAKGDGGGKVHITSGKDGGKFSLNGGGVNINFDLPDFAKIDIDDDFDIDGVQLYPGSHVTSINIDANDQKNGEDAVVRFGFTAPAVPAKAADWMAAEFAKKDRKVTRTGDILRGTSKDGDDFTITFVPDGKTAKGEVLILSK